MNNKIRKESFYLVLIGIIAAGLSSSTFVQNVSAVTPCPPETKFNSATSQCVAPPICPASSYVSGPTCVNGSLPLCPAGTVFKEETGLCISYVVDIDIKPKEPKNTISINNDNTVRVAIFGSTITSVNQIDISPLSEDAPKLGGSTPQAPVSTNLEDIDKDGIMDLVLKYNIGKTNPLGFTGSDTLGCINGKLIDGTPLRGCDIVRIIK